MNVISLASTFTLKSVALTSYYLLLQKLPEFLALKQFACFNWKKSTLIHLSQMNRPVQAVHTADNPQWTKTLHIDKQKNSNYHTRWDQNPVFLLAVASASGLCLLWKFLRGASLDRRSLDMSPSKALCLSHSSSHQHNIWCSSFP